MIEQGKVVSVTANRATVRINKKTECDKCGMCLFPKGASYTEVSALNTLNASVGDTVTIETAKDAKFLGAILVFLIPLLLIGISAIIGIMVIQNELWVLGLSILSIALWFVVLSLIDKKLKKLTGFAPVIVSIDTKN